MDVRTMKLRDFDNLKKKAEIGVTLYNGMVVIPKKKVKCCQNYRMVDIVPTIDFRPLFMVVECGTILYNNKLNICFMRFLPISKLLYLSCTMFD